MGQTGEADFSLPGNPRFPTKWPNIGTNGSYDSLDDADGAMYRTDYKVRRSKDDVFDGTSNTHLRHPAEHLGVCGGRLAQHVGVLKLALRRLELRTGRRLAEVVDDDVWH